MIQTATPGIYILEKASGPRPIQPVGMSTAGFVGRAPNSRAPVNDAIAINGWRQFVNIFVGESKESTDLSRAVFGFFENRGSRCWVVNIGDAKSLTGGATRAGIDLLEEIEEVAIVAAPGFTDAAHYDAAPQPLRAPRLPRRRSSTVRPRRRSSQAKLTQQLTTVKEDKKPSRRGGGGRRRRRSCAGSDRLREGLRPSARRTMGSGRSTSRGFARWIRSRRRSSTPRRRGTWRASGPAPTQRAGFTRRRRTRSWPGRWLVQLSVSRIRSRPSSIRRA